MEVTIKISEGCINYSYTINDVEWVDLVYEESNKCNPYLVNSVCEKLIEEIQKQYKLPDWVLDFFNDGYNDCEDVDCTQDTFIKLVKNNLNTKKEYLGICEECGDSTIEYTLKIDIKDCDYDNR